MYPDISLPASQWGGGVRVRDLRCGEALKTLFTLSVVRDKNNHFCCPEPLFHKVEFLKADSVDGTHELENSKTTFPIAASTTDTTNDTVKDTVRHGMPLQRARPRACALS